MKLHKANTNGSLSLTIPKDIIELLGWKEKDDIIILTTEDDTMLKLANKTLRSRK